MEFIMDPKGNPKPADASQQQSPQSPQQQVPQPAFGEPHPGGAAPDGLVGDLTGGMTGGSQNAGAPGAVDAIKDVTAATFMQDVVQASMQGPVLVDFWAPWCEPCKSLTPTLEKLVRQTGGQVKLAKINIDQEKEIAVQLRIQSVPTVYAFHQGQPVDAFQGALPESELREFINRLLGDQESPIDGMIEAAEELMRDGNHADAKQVFEEVLHQDPTHPGAVGGMLRILVANKELDQAQGVLDRLPPDVRNRPEVTAAAAALELARSAGDAADLSALEAAVASDPKKPEPRFDLAKALYAAGRNEEAIDHLIEIVRTHRAWNDEAARTLLVKVFDALGPKDPLVAAGRRKLSTVLFS